MPKVSIIIPVYNVEKYLQECLDSVINQTFSDIEIICINDGSTDNSLRILEENAQKDNRIKIINQENQGQGAARNKGMDISNGKYIFFLDSDDYILPNTIEILYNKTLETESDIIAIKAQAFADNNDEETKKRTDDMNEWLDKLVSDYKVSIDNYEYSISNLRCTIWGKLYSKDFLIKNHLRFIDQNYKWEDNGFWIKVLACFPTITYLGNICLMYRISQNSTTSKPNIKNQIKDLQVVINDSFLYFNTYKKDLSKNLKKQIIYSNIFAWLYEKNFGFWYKHKFSKSNSFITILGIPIYRKKITEQYKIIRIIGIPIYKKALP